MQGTIWNSGPRLSLKACGDLRGEHARIEFVRLHEEALKLM